jgi:DNA-directed RNA polymerase II subunit RPB1
VWETWVESSVQYNGFSIGIGDTIADKKTMAFITRQIAERKSNVSRIIEDAHHDRLKAAPGMTIRESFESRVERELNLARDHSGQYAQKNLKEDNNVKGVIEKIAGPQPVGRPGYQHPHSSS